LQDCGKLQGSTSREVQFSSSSQSDKKGICEHIHSGTIKVM